MKIITRKQLQDVISQDVSVNVGGWKSPQLRFLVLHRHFEFHSNNKGLYHRLLKFFYWILKRNLGLKLGFTIPVNVFGAGLCIAHYGLLVVSSKATIGNNCRVHAGVNIGEKDGKAPVIGDNVYIGPGAKIFGDIKIGNNVTIGANAVVNKSFPDNCVIAGIPAKIIKYKQ